MNLLQSLKENPFLLAPMAGITDHAFRSFMRQQGCGIVTSELISATGLHFKSDKTIKLMGFDNFQKPVGIQLFGDDPIFLAEAARFVESMGADFVDLNFGCPVPKVVKKGAGSAMMKDLMAMTEVLKSVKSAIQIPLTIKIRTGWDENSRNAIDVCDLAYNEGVTWVAIHGRTRAQGYSGLADWEFICQVKAKSKIPIIGNGDLISAEIAVQRLKYSGCDAVMIGRGCLKNPYLFQECLNLWRTPQNPEKITKNLSELFINLKTQLEKHYSSKLLQIQLKKFAAWYSSGYQESTNFRKHIFQLKTVEEIMDLTLNYFEKNSHLQQENTSQEAFLMGGHG